MSQRLKIRVVMQPDGKSPRLDVMFRDAVIDEISYLELVEHITQCASALRYFPHSSKVRAG